MNPADLALPAFADNPLSASTNGVPNGLGLTGAGLGGKTIRTSMVPRIDTEPIYSALKQCIGDRWSDYKGALGGFLLGKLNQAELTSYLAPILQSAALPPLPPLNLMSTTPHLFSTAPTALHLHNALLSAIYANALYRDPPPEPTAQWVLATDSQTPHPSTSTAQKASGLGDKINDRNKREVMSLPARDRRRLKSVNDTPPTPGPTPAGAGALASSVTYKRALAPIPSNLSAPPPTLAPSGLAGLGDDASDSAIRRRFALPLAAETAEFPSRENIGARIEPIAAEEGLGSLAASSLGPLSELLESSLECYVKELIGSVFTAARCDGEGLVQSAGYRTRVRGEERGEDEGSVERDVLGRLPVEREMVEKRRGLDGGDFRLVVRLEGGRWREDRFLGTAMGEEGGEEDEEEEEEVVEGKVNGVKKDVLMSTGVGGHEDDGGGFGWAGSSGADRNALKDVLMGALAIG